MARSGSSIPVSSLSATLVYLESGNIVPADLRLLETMAFKCEESTLTGESDSIEKDATLLYQEELNPGDQRNMAFMSTIVTSGHALGIVVRCAKDSEVGKIASMLKEHDEERTPLQERLAHLSAVLGIMALVICALMFVIGTIQGKGIFDMLLLSISLAVAAIPEGLPAVVTIVLAFGVQAMSRRNAIVRRLHAVETLGSVNVICSDKTGTLTMNQMRVAHVFCPGSSQPIRICWNVPCCAITRSSGKRLPESRWKRHCCTMPEIRGSACAPCVNAVRACMRSRLTLLASA